MKIYHVCECCDQVYEITDSVSRTSSTELDNLTGAKTGDIMILEPENGSSVVSGLCYECYEEIYGTSEHFFYSSRLN
ncbi:hypothetical protein [Sporotomaculum syntrophicum]|uniref:hypothetical protein n=1 Tax=Sporotomaculum syntrophicum TaxID=182264 RepID=UPI00137B792E|nr:hypothetical protein [Sporotomaculum syntrophicum]